MAIYQIPTLEKAVEIMEAAYLTPWEYVPIIFDLAEDVIADDVRTRISRCLTCDLTIHQNLGEYLDECPRCFEDHLQELVDVQMVVQRSIVVHTAWRDQ
jgi:hypothetical protein